MGRPDTRIQQPLEKTETFREHVKNCRDCVVDEDGQVWACEKGCQLRQRERKARL